MIQKNNIQKKTWTKVVYCLSYVHGIFMQWVLCSSGKDDWPVGCPPNHLTTLLNEKSADHQKMKEYILQWRDTWVRKKHTESMDACRIICSDCPVTRQVYQWKAKFAIYINWRLLAILAIHFMCMWFPFSMHVWSLWSDIAWQLYCTISGLWLWSDEEGEQKGQKLGAIVEEWCGSDAM